MTHLEKAKRIIGGALLLLLGSILLLAVGMQYRIVPAAASEDFNYSENKQIIPAPPIISVVFDSKGEIIENNGETFDRLPVVSGYATAPNMQIRLRYSDNDSVFKMTSTAAVEAEPGKYFWLYTFSASDSFDEGLLRFRATAYDTDLNVESVGSNNYFVRIVPRLLHIPFIQNRFLTLFNGDFEAGLAGWTASDSNNYGVGVADDQLSGRAALLGTAGYIPDEAVPVGYGEIRKKVTVPLDQPTLSFDYLLMTYDVGFSENKDAFYDTFEVYINEVGDENGKTPERVLLCSAAEKGKPVAPASGTSGLIFCDNHVGAPSKVDPATAVENLDAALDLQNYAGQNIELIFRVYNRVDGYYNSYLYLDNLRWSASTGR